MSLSCQVAPNSSDACAVNHSLSEDCTNPKVLSRVHMQLWLSTVLGYLGSGPEVKCKLTATCHLEVNRVKPQR